MIFLRSVIHTASYSADKKNFSVAQNDHYFNTGYRTIQTTAYTHEVITNRKINVEALQAIRQTPMPVFPKYEGFTCGVLNGVGAGYAGMIVSKLMLGYVCWPAVLVAGVAAGIFVGMHQYHILVGPRREHEMLCRIAVISETMQETLAPEEVAYLHSLRDEARLTVAANCLLREIFKIYGLSLYGAPGKQVAA